QLRPLLEQVLPLRRGPEHDGLLDLRRAEPHEWKEGAPVSYTTTYTYDKSRRLMQQFRSFDGGAVKQDFHYYTYNQRNMITKIGEGMTGFGRFADADRTFVYNALGERLVAVDNTNSLSAYWSYDGRRLL